jgi:toxin ParE2
MKHRFLAKAASEYADAAAYYASEDPNLAVELERDIDGALDFLSGFPLAAKRLDANYRSHKLRRFPYCLIYRLDGDEIVVVAVAHVARRPDYWRSRDDGSEL